LSQSIADALRLLADAIETEKAVKIKMVSNFDGHSKIHSVEQIPLPYPKAIRHWIPFWQDKKRWPDDCVEWDGRQRQDYGLIRFASNRPEQIDVMSHRVAFLFAYRKIENGLVVHHVCNTKLCINPAHLEAMDRSKNATLGLARHHGLIDD